MSALERALADLVGGVDGGFSLWSIACGKLEQVAAGARDEYRFRSYPSGALNRLLVDLEDVLRVATLAVELQTTLDGETDPTSPEQRQADIAGLLLDRAREMVRERIGVDAA